MNFSEQIKSLKCYKQVKDAFMRGKLSQAYLFVCEDGLTLDALLLELSKLLVCSNGNACGTCPNCLKVMAGTHPDVNVSPMGKCFVVEDANKIYDTIQFKPMLANKKIYVINDISNSTEQAQNKMLKVIEEPPDDVVFLISASEQKKVLDTILSRTQKMDVDKMDKSVLARLLNCNEETKNIALFCGDGYLGKTLNIVQNDSFINCYKDVFNIIKNMKKSEQVPSFSGVFSKNRATFEQSLNILNDFFRDLLMIKINEDLCKNINLIDSLKVISNEYSASALLTILGRLNQINRKINSNVNLVLLADNMLLEILEVKFLCK